VGEARDEMGTYSTLTQFIFCRTHSISFISLSDLLVAVSQYHLFPQRVGVVVVDGIFALAKTDAEVRGAREENLTDAR
jgi:hypothetical protein